MENFNKVCGIYKITNIHNGHFYIGSSYNVGKRITQHKADLRKNKHHSPYLQRSWNIYGEGGFIFSVIEECSRDDLLSIEQKYLDDLSPDYNVSKSAVSPMTGNTHSMETREKIKPSCTTYLPKIRWSREQSTQINMHNYHLPGLIIKSLSKNLLLQRE